MASTQGVPSDEGKKAFPVKIGLEIHGYLDTNEKLFCMCKTDSLSSDSNTNVCPICTGQPGSKPMAPNSSAVEKMIQIAFVLKSRINDKPLVWQRKHYNWADLPKGYQTTISGAHAAPCCIGGKFKGINITEAHLEEDPAQWNPDSGKINYNRSGLPLIEIVTEPEFSDSEQVVEWLKALVLSLSYIKAVRKNAGIKVDVNVSTYGERVEMKNLNSLEKIRKAIEYEIVRQVEAHANSEVQKRDTLAFDEKLGKTIKMRSKEGAADYRFISDPDLPVIKIDKKLVNEIKANMPEMPEEKLSKLLKKYSVGEKDAKILTRNLELVEFFEKLVNYDIDTKKHMSWITIELLRVLNYNNKSLEDGDVDVRPEHLAELIKAVAAGDVTVLKGKQIMNEFIPKSFSLKEHKGEISNIDDAAIENLCKQVISENVKVVDEYKGGKDASLNYLIGQVMRLSERRADFKVAGETMKMLIGGQEIKVIKRKIVVSLSRDNIIKRLEEFNKGAKEILNLSFKDQLKGSGVTIKWSKDDGVMRSELRGPDDESIKALCNDLRKFIQPNDSLKIEKLVPLYQSEFISRKLLKMFGTEMSEINEFLKQSSNHRINGHDYSNEEIFKIFLYGKVSHRTSGKKEEHDFLEGNILYNSLKNIFIGAIANYLRLINNIVFINNKALKEIKK